MIKLNTPPPYSSAEPSRTVVPIPSDVKVHPAPSDVKTPPTTSDPTPSNPFLETNPRQEARCQTSLQNLEHQINSYQHDAREGGATEQEGAERVAQAMENIADNHTDSKVKAQWKQHAKKFRKANPKEREGVLIGILKGSLIFLTSPFYIVGTTLHATGEILDGIGFVLKSAGQLMKKLTYMGGSFSKR